MPQAIVDPEELRQFARSLKKFNAELRDRMTALTNQLNSLGASWRDQEHTRFLEQFEQEIRAIGRLTEVTDQHVPYLLRKAQHVEDYFQS